MSLTHLSRDFHHGSAILELAADQLHPCLVTGARPCSMDNTERAAHREGAPVHRPADHLGTCSAQGPQESAPGLNAHELVQKWIDRITGAAPTDVPDPVGDIVEGNAIDTMKRADIYVGLLQHSEDKGSQIL